MLFRPKPTFKDRVWTSQGLKEHDIIRGVRSSLNAGKIPVAVVHFYKSITYFSHLFIRNGLKVHQMQGLSELDGSSHDPGHPEAQVLLMDSDLVTRNALKSFGRDQKELQYDLHLLERYPLPEPDQRILDLVNLRHDFSPPTAYVALDEPWIIETMGDRFTEILDRLGMNRNEVIEHSMISSSLRQAQRKMEEKVVRDYPQDSQEKWLAFNLKA